MGWPKAVFKPDMVTASLTQLDSVWTSSLLLWQMRAKNGPFPRSLHPSVTGPPALRGLSPAAPGFCLLSSSPEPFPVEDVKCFPVASRLEKEGQLLPLRSLVLILCDWMGPSPKARSLDGLATALVPVPFSSPWRSGCQAGVLTSAITSARQSHPVALGGLIA